MSKNQKLLQLLRKLMLNFSAWLAIIGCGAIYCFYRRYNLPNVESVLVSAVGGSFISAGLTVLLMANKLLDAGNRDCLAELGVKTASTGRMDIAGEKGFATLLQESRPREIDLIGIAMYSLLEEQGLLEALIDAAAAGFRVRVAFADPNSPELKAQETAEGKPGLLKFHIESQMRRFQERVSEHTERCKINSNLTIWYSKLLPKNFIMRAGNFMTVSAYLMDKNGPSKSPTIVLERKGNGFFERYMDYIDSTFTDRHAVMQKVSTNGQ